MLNNLCSNVQDNDVAVVQDENKCYNSELFKRQREQRPPAILCPPVVPDLLLPLC